jgi:superfamily I DNA/RNA helicase
MERVAKLALVARDAAKERDLQGRVGFDDMIFLPVALRLARPWYDMVIIDEAQDMNAAQILLARASCKKTGRIVVVGDDRQAIYGFRGADAGSLDRLKAELSATELPLTVTYRCGKSIVARAASIVPDFTAAPSAPDGIVDSLPNEDELFKNAKPGDFVLCRRNAPLMSTCLGFLKRGIAARVEGRDVATGLKVAVSKLRAKSVPDFIERVGGWLKKEVARASKISSEDARQDKVDRLSDQADALVALAEGCASVAEIGVRIETLFGDHGEGGPRQIVCSSIHRAKGLEADRVFVLVEEKKRPGRGGKEEANIDYVAVTRARLHFTTVTLRGRGAALPINSAGSASSVPRAPRAPSRHVGTLGKRQTFRLTVDRIFDTDGQWGTTHIHQMRDGDGNVFKWFTTSEKLDAGKTYDVKGTVKNHETYRGEAQTILTRCVATEVAGGSAKVAGRAS